MQQQQQQTHPCHTLVCDALVGRCVRLDPAHACNEQHRHKMCASQSQQARAECGRPCAYRVVGLHTAHQFVQHVGDARVGRQVAVDECLVAEKLWINLLVWSVFDHVAHLDEVVAELERTSTELKSLIAQCSRPTMIEQQRRSDFSEHATTILCDLSW